jgi:hypothetical protein
VLFPEAGLREVAVLHIDVPTSFSRFEVYWQPFLKGHFPAPAYLKSLDYDQQVALCNKIVALLPIRHDGTIDLIARVWTARGKGYG